MARQVAEILNFLQFKIAIIGGLSMGGYVMFNLYRLFPQKFAGLILAGTTYLADKEEKRQARFYLITKIEKQGSKALIENMLPNLISDDTKNNNSSLTAELENIFSEFDPISAVSLLKSMAERRDYSDILRKISVPTHLNFGESDKVTNLEYARKVDETIPLSNLVVIEKAGHYLNLEQPENSNQVLTDFCSSVNF